MSNAEFTIAEAAQALGITEGAIRKRVRRGEMQARRVGRRVLVIPASEVERWRGVGKLRPGPKRATEA